MKRSKVEYLILIALIIVIGYTHHLSNKKETLYPEKDLSNISLDEIKDADLGGAEIINTLSSSRSVTIIGCCGSLYIDSSTH